MLTLRRTKRWRMLCGWTRQWVPVLVGKNRDVSETETMMIIAGQVEQSDNSDQGFSKWVDNAVGMVKGTGGGSAVVRHAGSDMLWPDNLTWTTVEEHQRYRGRRGPVL